MSGWKIYRHCQIGTRHLRGNEPCQDAVRTVENGDIAAAVVSDGVSFYPNSHYASESAVKTCCGWILNNKDILPISEINDIREDLYSALRENLSELSQKTGYDFDCNLAFVCVFKERNIAIIGNIGDAAVCVINDSGNSRVLSTTGAGANSTDGILSSKDSQVLNVQKILLEDSDVGFIATTDGLEDAIYAKGSTVPKKRAEKFFNISLSDEPEQNLQAEINRFVDLDVTHDDDIGVAILSRTEIPVTLEADPTWLCTCGERNTFGTNYCKSCKADYLTVYENVDFGGETPSEFFRRINKNSELEASLLPKVKKPVFEGDSNYTPIDSHEIEKNSKPEGDEKMQENSVAEAKTEKKNWTIPLALGISAASLCVVLASVCIMGAVLSNQKIFNERLNELRVMQSQLIETVSNDSEFDPAKGYKIDGDNTFITLKNGDLYIGELKNNKPEGSGVLITEDSYYIGNFSHGKKDGDFVVVDREDNTIRKENY